MRKELRYKKERDRLFNAVQEIFETDHDDFQKSMQKIMKAIAANSSFTLQFLNLAYIAINDIKKDIAAKDTDKANQRLDSLEKDILEFRKHL